MKWIPVLLLSLVVACGGNDTDDDMDTTTSMDTSTTMDTSTATDASGDASATSCQSFCDSMKTNCATEYDSLLGGDVGCVDDCNAQSQTVQACWDKHLGFAIAGSASTHCPHAAGDTTPAAGTPSDCLRDGT